MLQTLRNAWKIEELRKKILFTLLIILLYRLGNSIPVPYVNTAALSQYFTYMQNTVLGLHKIGNETVQPDNPQTRGKLAQIGYLVKVTEE